MDAGPGHHGCASPSRHTAPPGPLDAKAASPPARQRRRHAYAEFGETRSRQPPAARPPGPGHHQPRQLRRADPAATRHPHRHRPTIGVNLLGHGYNYRTTVAPWFRGLFAGSPDVTAIAHAPLIYQVHVTAAWLIWAVWPFSRLVHAWSYPL